MILDSSDMIASNCASGIGGLGELAAVADAGELAALQNVSAVGEVPGQQ